MSSAVPLMPNPLALAVVGALIDQGWPGPDEVAAAEIRHARAVCEFETRCDEVPRG